MSLFAVLDFSLALLIGFVVGLFTGPVFFFFLLTQFTRRLNTQSKRPAKRSASESTFERGLLTQGKKQKRGSRAEAKNAAAVMNASVDFQKIKTSEIEIPVIAADVLVYEPGELGSSYPERTRLYYSPEALSDPEYLQTVLRSPLVVGSHEKSTTEFNRDVDGWPLSAEWDEREQRVKVRGVLHGEENVAYAEANKGKPSFGTSAYISFLEIDRTPGTSPDGKPYDAVVKKAVNNHIAILPNIRDPKNVILAMNAVADNGPRAVATDNANDASNANEVSISELMKRGHSKEVAKRLVSMGLKEFDGGYKPTVEELMKRGHSKEVAKRLVSMGLTENAVAVGKNADVIYKKYMIKYNHLRGEYYITKDGKQIATAASIDDAKKQIDIVAGNAVAVDNGENADDPEQLHKWIKGLSAAHPEWEQDQVVAVAYKKIGENADMAQNDASTRADGGHVGYNSKPEESKNSNEEDKDKMDAGTFKEMYNAMMNEEKAEGELVEKVANAVMAKMNAKNEDGEKKPGEKNAKNEDKPEEKKEEPVKNEDKKEEDSEASNALPSEAMVKDFADALGVTFKKAPSFKELATLSGVTAENPAALIAALNAKRETFGTTAKNGAEERNGATSVAEVLRSL